MHLFLRVFLSFRSGSRSGRKRPTSGETPPSLCGKNGTNGRSLRIRPVGLRQPHELGAGKKKPPGQPQPTEGRGYPKLRNISDS